MRRLRPMRRSAGRGAGAAIALVAIVGCEPVPVSSGAEGFVPRLIAGDPVVQIGVLEGADEYTFGAISNVVRLADGSFAVADGLSQRVSIYDAEGGFVRAWGQKGDGPKEFDNLGGVIPHGTDSLMTAETFRDQLKVFDLEGNPGRTLGAIELSNDSTFRLDSWLHGRYWVQGAITPAERTRTRRALDAHTPPAEAPGMRVAVVADDGSVWIPEPLPGGLEAGQWTRLDPDGTPSASLGLPVAFRPTHFETDRVTGVWRDDNDVNYVRSYVWSADGAESGLPEWLWSEGDDGIEPPVEAASEAEIMDEMRMAIRSLAGAQEMNYSRAMSYTDDVSDLTELEVPEGLHISFTKGDSRGWTAVFAHDGLSRICGLSYGFDMPLGWTPGAMICAPEGASAR